MIANRMAPPVHETLSSLRGRVMEGVPGITLGSLGAASLSALAIMTPNAAASSVRESHPSSFDRPPASTVLPAEGRIGGLPSVDSALASINPVQREAGRWCLANEMRNPEWWRFASYTPSRDGRPAVVKAGVKTFGPVYTKTIVTMNQAGQVIGTRTVTRPCTEIVDAHMTVGTYIDNDQGKPRDNSSERHLDLGKSQTKQYHFAQDQEYTCRPDRKRRDIGLVARLVGKITSGRHKGEMAHRVRRLATHGTGC
jgi:hypothetical protein